MIRVTDISVDRVGFTLFETVGAAKDYIKTEIEENEEYTSTQDMLELVGELEECVPVYWNDRHGDKVFLYYEKLN